MIKTSQNLIDNMRGTQTVSARVNILNSSAFTSYGYEINDILPYLIQNKYFILKNQNIYESNNLNDCLIHETGNYANFENDGILLDGSVNVLEKNMDSLKIGYISNSLSDNECNFNNPIIFSWAFNIEENSNLNIVFSKIKNEYAVDFDIIYERNINDSGNVPEPIITHVINNSSKHYIFENADSGKYTIKIFKWSSKNSRAKILSLYLGELLEYNDEEIKSIDVRKGVDLTNQNIESKNLELILIDKDENYNIFNPVGKLANLNMNSRCSIELGTVMDSFIYYVKVDEFIIKEPKKENEVEIKLEGFGRIQQYSDYNFLACNYEKTSMDILIEGYNGYENENYMKLESELKNLKFRTQYGENTNFIDGIRKLSYASKCNVFETINNDICFKSIKESEEEVAIIELKNMIDIPKIIKKTIPKEIEISTFIPTITENNVELYKQEPFRMYNQDYNIKFNVEHSAPPYSATLQPWEGEIRNLFEYGLIKINDSYAIFRGYMDNEDWWETCVLEIRGSKVETLKNTMIYNTNNQNNEKLVIESESIDNSELSYSVFNWIKSNLEKCFEYEIEIQDTFTYELGDTIKIETGIYNDNTMIFRNAIIVGIEYKYDGILEYRLNLKGE